MGSVKINGFRIGSYLLVLKKNVSNIFLFQYSSSCFIFHSNCTLSLYTCFSFFFPLSCAHPRVVFSASTPWTILARSINPAVCEGMRHEVSKAESFPPFLSVCDFLLLFACSQRQLRREGEKETIKKMYLSFLSVSFHTCLCLVKICFWRHQGQSVSSSMCCCSSLTSSNS